MPVFHRFTRAAATVLCALAGAAHAASFDPELRLRSDRHSDFSSLNQLANLDEKENIALVRPRAGRNLAYIDDEARLGLHQGDWTWSLVARSRATLVLREQTIRAVQHAVGATRGNEDAQWQIDARLRGFRGVGMEARHDMDLGSGWRLGIATQGLVLTGLRERSVTGDLRYRASTAQYSGAVSSSERSERLRFPFQGDVTDTGFGLLMTADADWQGRSFGFGLGLRDVGALYWRNLPSQTFTASSNTAGVDADGFLVYRPLIQGQNRQRSTTVAAPAWMTLHADWRATPRGTLRASADVLAAYGALPSLRWTQSMPGDWQWMAGWRVRERRLSVGVVAGGLSLELGTDRLGSGARSQLVSLAWRRAF